MSCGSGSCSRKAFNWSVGEVRWMAFAEFPLLLDLNGLTEVTLRLVRTPQLALVHLHKVADRKANVGDTAAKTPIPTAL